MNSYLRRYLFLIFVVAIGGLAVMTLAGNHRATGGTGGGCGGGCPSGAALAPAGDPVVPVIDPLKIEAPVVLDAAEAADPKAEMPKCKACKAAGGMCGHCKDGTMQKCGAKIDELKTGVDAAKAALEAGDSKAALAELTKVQALIASMQEMRKTMMAKPAAAAAVEGQVINAKCPIMGTKLDQAKVPAELRREFNGQTVGFCCGGCPAAWDKLSPEEKQTKLDAAK